MSAEEIVDDSVTAQRHAVRNREEIERSHLCGCFHCAAIFRPGSILAWRRDGPGPRPDTARCPQCGIDAVIGAASGLPIKPDFLRRMQRHWYRK